MRSSSVPRSRSRVSAMPILTRSSYARDRSMGRDMSPITEASRERLRRLPIDLGMSLYDKGLSLSAHPFSGHNGPVLLFELTSNRRPTTFNRDFRRGRGTEVTHFCR